MCRNIHRCFIFQSSRNEINTVTELSLDRTLSFRCLISLYEMYHPLKSWTLLEWIFSAKIHIRLIKPLKQAQVKHWCCNERMYSDYGQLPKWHRLFSQLHVQPWQPHKYAHAVSNIHGTQVANPLNRPYTFLRVWWLITKNLKPKSTFRNDGRSTLTFFYRPAKNYHVSTPFASSVCRQLFDLTKLPLCFII